MQWRRQIKMAFKHKWNLSLQICLIWQSVYVWFILCYFPLRRCNVDTLTLQFPWRYGIIFYSNFIRLAWAFLQTNQKNMRSIYTLFKGKKLLFAYNAGQEKHTASNDNTQFVIFLRRMKCQRYKWRYSCVRNSNKAATAVMWYGGITFSMSLLLFAISRQFIFASNASFSVSICFPNCVCFAWHLKKKKKNKTTTKELHFKFIFEIFSHNHGHCFHHFTQESCVFFLLPLFCRRVNSKRSISDKQYTLRMGSEGGMYKDLREYTTNHFYRDCDRDRAK